MNASRITLAVAMGAVIAGACVVAEAVTEASPAGSTEWNFKAWLDGTPIGEHRFTVSTRGSELRVTTEANFAVKVLGFTAYRYRHVATERWRDGCLESLDAATDDDGKKINVRTSAEGRGLKVTAPSGAEDLSGCVMSFAYWNPAIQNQSHLLNAQTGKYEPVEVSRLGSGTVDVRGQPVAATRFRIKGAEQPIDIWYTATGDWIGLDSTVAGGRKLSYRLQ